jgi:hypothetical protein
MIFMQHGQIRKRSRRLWAVVAAGSASAVLLSASANASRMHAHHASHTNQDELLFVPSPFPGLHTNQDRWRPIPPKEDDEEEDKKGRGGDRMMDGGRLPSPDLGGLETLLFRFSAEEGPSADHLQHVPGSDVFELWSAGHIGAGPNPLSSAGAFAVYTIPGPGVLMPLLLAGALGRSRRRR